MLLLVLLVLFLQSFGVEGRGGLLGVAVGTAGGAWDVRLVDPRLRRSGSRSSPCPCCSRCPSRPRPTRGPRGRRCSRSYRRLWARRSPSCGARTAQVLLFLLASAVFRDGLAAVFTFGAIIAAQVFGFTPSEVIYFAVAANVVGGDRHVRRPVASTTASARRRSSSARSSGSSWPPSRSCSIGDGKIGFWIGGLVLAALRRTGRSRRAGRSWRASRRPAARARSSGCTPRPGAR